MSCLKGLIFLELNYTKYGKCTGFYDNNDKIRTATSGNFFYYSDTSSTTAQEQYLSCCRLIFSLNDLIDLSFHVCFSSVSAKQWTLETQFT
jgi:hypothetical protein